MTIKEYWNLIGWEPFLAITWELDFSQACSFHRMLMNHKNFHVTKIPDKTNDVIFLKSPKGMFLGHFWPFVFIFAKYNHIWAPNTILKGCSYGGELARLGRLAHLSEISPSLKVVSATFLLVCFVCLTTESTCKTRKNAFYFTLKTLLVLEIINFWHFIYSNIMTSSNSQAWSTKHILVNNFGKCSLVMKFGQFMQYYKTVFLLKNSTKNVV